MIIRKAKQKDVKQIKKIDCLGEILNRCSPLDKLDSKAKPKKGERNYYERFVYGKLKWCYVAELGGRIVGFILFEIENRKRWWKVKKAGYIDLIVVDKKHRGNGISKLLLNKAYEIFKDHKLDYVKLCVQTGNKKAHEIWKKQGYKDYRAEMWKRLR